MSFLSDAERGARLRESKAARVSGQSPDALDAREFAQTRLAAGRGGPGDKE